MYHDDGIHRGQIAFTEVGIMPRVWDSPYDVDPEDLDFIFKKDLEFFNENMELPEVFYKIETNEIIYDINELRGLEVNSAEEKEKETKNEEKGTDKMKDRATYEWEAGPYPSAADDSGDYVVFYGTPDGEGGFNTGRAFAHWNAATEIWEGIKSDWIVFAALKIPKNPKVFFRVED